MVPMTTDIPKRCVGGKFESAKMPNPQQMMIIENKIGRHWPNAASCQALPRSASAIVRRRTKNMVWIMASTPIPIAKFAAGAEIISTGILKIPIKPSMPAGIKLRLSASETVVWTEREIIQPIPRKIARRSKIPETKLDVKSSAIWP